MPTHGSVIPRLILRSEKVTSYVVADFLVRHAVQKHQCRNILPHRVSVVLLLRDRIVCHVENLQIVAQPQKHHAVEVFDFVAKRHAQ